jgi:hypothetical protein
METTVAFDVYWRFAAERLSMFYRRLSDPQGPWTNDPIMRAYRFTNSYRIADRVSQYLVRDVQYRADRSQEPSEIVFRTLLFKMFNKIRTWQTLETMLGPLSWRTVNLEAINDALTAMLAKGTRI